jgi:hypothetical protein
MKYLLAVLLLLTSVVSFAEEYLVMYYNPNVRIVLVNKECLFKELSGKRAAAQRSDGQVLQGCWVPSKDGKQVTIKWHNPAAPDDSSTFDLDRFMPVIEGDDKSETIKPQVIKPTL